MRYLQCGGAASRGRAGGAAADETWDSRGLQLGSSGGPGLHCSLAWHPYLVTGAPEGKWAPSRPLSWAWAMSQQQLAAQFAVRKQRQSCWPLILKPGIPFQIQNGRLQQLVPEWHQRTRDGVPAPRTECWDKHTEDSAER